MAGVSTFSNDYVAKLEEDRALLIEMFSILMPYMSNTEIIWAEFSPEETASIVAAREALSKPLPEKRKSW